MSAEYAGMMWDRQSPSVTINPEAFENAIFDFARELEGETAEETFLLKEGGTSVYFKVCEILDALSDKG